MIRTLAVVGVGVSAGVVVFSMVTVEVGVSVGKAVFSVLLHPEIPRAKTRDNTINAKLPDVFN